MQVEQKTLGKGVVGKQASTFTLKIQVMSQSHILGKRHFNSPKTSTFNLNSKQRLCLPEVCTGFE